MKDELFTGTCPTCGQPDLSLKRPCKMCKYYREDKAIKCAAMHTMETRHAILHSPSCIYDPGLKDRFIGK